MGTVRNSKKLLTEVLKLEAEWKVMCKQWGWVIWKASINLPGEKGSGRRQRLQVKSTAHAKENSEAMWCVWEMQVSIVMK